MPDDPDPRIVFLRKALQGDIESFRARRKENRSKAFWTKMAITLSAALTTVILGLKDNQVFHGAENHFAAMALTLSATATLVSTWETFFDHRWLWIRYTTTVSLLHGIADDLEYAVAGGDVRQATLDALHQRRQKVLQDDANAWAHKREGEGEGGAGNGPKSG